MRVVVRELGWKCAVASCGVCRAAIWCGVAGTGSLIVTGQLSWLLLWPLTALMGRYAERPLDAAGLLVGLLASIKPFLLLLLAYFVLRREKRALVVSLAAIASAFVVGNLVFGFAAHVSWARSLGGMNWSWVGSNASMLGVLSACLRQIPK